MHALERRRSRNHKLGSMPVVLYSGRLHLDEQWEIWNNFAER